MGRGQGSGRGGHIKVISQIETSSRDHSSHNNNSSSHLSRPCAVRRTRIHTLFTGCRDFFSALLHQIYRSQESDSPEKEENCPKSQVLQVALCTTPGVLLRYVIDLYVYSEKFLASGSKVSRERLFLIIPKLSKGWLPGHLFLSPGTVVPHSCATGQLSLAAALVWPTGVEPGRITPFPALFPPWLRADMAIFGCLLLGVACSFGQMTARAGVRSSPRASSPASGDPEVGGGGGSGWAQAGTLALGTGGRARVVLAQEEAPERAHQPASSDQGGDPRSDTTASGRRSLGRSSPWSSCSFSPGGPLSLPLASSSSSCST